jgi:hypothetical protein
MVFHHVSASSEFLRLRGGREPLRLVPNGRTLGVVTTQSGTPESTEHVKRSPSTPPAARLR